MTALLVDSNIVIEILRGRNTSIASQWNQFIASGGLLYYSPVTLAEVWSGVREREQDATGTAFAAMTCIPVDAAIGRKAGDYLRLFAASHGLELGDALIAATATVYRVPLWTRNRKHYPMKDLRLF